MFAIAPTDIGWYRYLRNNPIPEEVNFWTPTPCNVRRLSKGNKFLFLLKAPYRKICGCGFGSFKYYENLSNKKAWERFGTGNGVESLSELKNRFNTYSRKTFCNRFF
jgi:putative restriction endonuclease